MDEEMDSMALDELTRINDWWMYEIRVRWEFKCIASFWIIKSGTKFVCRKIRRTEFCLRILVKEFRSSMHDLLLMMVMWRWGMHRTVIISAVSAPQNIILTTTRWEVAEKHYKPGNLPTNVHKGAVQVERRVILNGCWVGGWGFGH